MKIRLTKPRIALDVDGCFADFNGFIMQNFGQEYNSILWPKIDKFDNLFQKLELLPDAKYMFDAIMDLFPEEYYDRFMLTALPLPTNKLLTADADKRIWIATNLSDSIPVHTAMNGESKGIWVNGPLDILVDDLQRNIDAWNLKGGKGILHTSVEQTLSILKSKSIFKKYDANFIKASG